MEGIYNLTFHEFGAKLLQMNFWCQEIFRFLIIEEFVKGLNSPALEGGDEGEGVKGSDKQEISAFFALTVSPLSSRDDTYPQAPLNTERGGEDGPNHEGLRKY